MFLSKILVAYSVTEKVTGRRYLVDTEAEVSIRPPLPSNQKTRYFLSSGHQQHVENNLRHTFPCTVRRTFRWVFVTADVEKHILVADFFKISTSWWI